MRIRDFRLPPPANLVPVLALSLWLGSAACASTDPQPEGGEDPASLGRTSSPMVGCFLDVDEPIRNAVVLPTTASSVAQLSPPSSPDWCTGTLIAPRLVLTAAHCVGIGAGSHVYVGVGRDMDPWPPIDPDTGAYNFSFIEDTLIPDGAWPEVIRTYEKNYVAEKPWNDVKILVLDRPIIHEAYAARPTFERPAMTPLPGTVSFTVLSAGMAGYGSPFFMESSNVPTARRIGWWLADQRGFALVESPDGDGAVWATTWNDISSYEGPSKGDSGGPLFWARDPSDPDGTRQQLGVTNSGSFQVSCGPACTVLGLLGHNLSDTEAHAIWADITHPATHTWIETVVAAEGGWLSGLDYVGSCDWLKDHECDHVYDKHDVCPDDYDPLQADTDGDGIGDICDNCWLQQNPDQANANREAENLSYDPNQRVDVGYRWDHAAVNAILQTNRAQRPGDACDPHPTEVTAGRGDSFDLPVALPAPWECGSVQGGVVTGCEWFVNNVIERDPIRSFGPPPVPFVATPGTTKMRYCPCDSDHETEAQRRMHADWCGCHRDEYSFSAYHPMTLDPWNQPPSLDPALDAVFSMDPGKRIADPVAWQWRSDLHAITGNVPPTIPTGAELTAEYRAQLSVEGILWSHVDQMGGTSYSAPFDFLASHFRALDVAVVARATGYKTFAGFMTKPWWALVGPDDCPWCAFRRPWLLYLDDPVGLVAGLVPEGPVDLGPMITEGFVSLYASASTDSNLELVGPSDAAHWIDHHGTGLRGVALRRDTGAIAGLVYAGDGGSLVAGELPPPIDDVIRAATSSSGLVAPGALLALSGARAELYDLSGGLLRRRSVPAGDWEAVALSGIVVPTNPVAMTYRYEDDSLYVVDRPSQHPPSARLLQIARDGSTRLRGVWISPPAVRSIQITTSDSGSLLLAVSRKHRYRIAELDPDRLLPGIVAVGGGNGELDGPARSDRRGVTVPVRGPDGSLSIEDVRMGDKKWHLPRGPGWCFE